MQTRRNHETEAAEIFIKARTGTRGKTIKKRKILQKRRGIVVIRILLNLQNIFYKANKNINVNQSYFGLMNKKPFCF